MSTVFIAAQYHLMLPDLSRLIVKVDIFIPVCYVKDLGSNMGLVTLKVNDQIKCGNKNKIFYIYMISPAKIKASVYFL